jgi:Ni/Fe-hydrogenase subunit HybB-like protein
VLTALLGYVIAAFSIVLDVGRWWQIYNPVLPANWQGNSPLFEVSLCVMAYATILILEFFPVVNERIQQGSSTFWKNLSGKIYGVLDRILFLLIILGVVVSTLHQSSLGSVVLIAKYRIDPLWWSPWLPLMFLVSAIAVGYPMVVIESWISSRAFGRRVEIDLLSGLARITPWVLGFYMILKVYDLIAAGEVCERLGSCVDRRKPPLCRHPVPDAHPPLRAALAEGTPDGEHHDGDRADSEPPGHLPADLCPAAGV